MTGNDENPHLPKAPRSRWLKLLGAMAIALGLGLAAFTAVTWAPWYEDEWPELVPFLVGGSSLALIWLGVRLWTGSWSISGYFGPDA